MATPQENTAKRMAADILVALIHNSRIFPPHHDNQEELANMQTQLLGEAYTGLLEMIAAVKVKETAAKRMATDILIAAIHSGRYYSNPVAQEEQVKEQIKILSQAYQSLVESFKGTKEV